MNEQFTLFDRLRWTIMLPKKEAEKWEDTDFKLVARASNSFTDDYQVLLIEPLTVDCQYTAEDVMEITDAIAVHEEFTNGILTTPEGVEEIGDAVYCWQGAGSCFLADMLTDVERLTFLMSHLYTEKKELIEIKDIDIIISKDGPTIPLGDNVDKLFTHDVYKIVWKAEEISVWWAFVIEEAGLFLVILDDELLWEDEEEEEQKLLPSPREYAGYDDLYPWGNYYDDYDYDDRYYRRT